MLLLSMCRSVYENLFSEGILKSFEDFEMNKEHSGLEFDYPLFQKEFMDLINNAKKKIIKDHLSLEFLIKKLHEIQIDEKLLLVFKSKLIIPNLLKNFKSKDVKLYIIDYSEKEDEFLCFSCSGNHQTLKLNDM